MKTLEHWVLRIADSDFTWIGLNWLRPDKHHRISFGCTLLSSILLGLPGVAVGTGLVYLVFGRVSANVWLSMFVLVMLFELPLNSLCAHFWNRRAEKLTQDVPTTAMMPPL